MGKEHVKLSEQVRRAVEESGMSRYAICKAIGMHESVMSRFMNGKGGLQQDSLDALADLLGLEIRVAKGRGGRPMGPGGKGK
jgi:transcriptional regulator with XRE-family HTH domain